MLVASPGRQTFSCLVWHSESVSSVPDLRKCRRPPLAFRWKTIMTLLMLANNIPAFSFSLDVSRVLSSWSTSVYELSARPLIKWICRQGMPAAYSLWFSLFDSSYSYAYIKTNSFNFIFIFIYDNAPFLYYLCEISLPKNVCVSQLILRVVAWKLWVFRFFLSHVCPCLEKPSSIRLSWWWRENMQLQFLCPLNPYCRTSTWGHTSLEKETH